jgi:cytochrome c-type biogenesis protein CcmE
LTCRGRRLSLIAAALIVVGAAAGIALYALSDSIVFFYSPTEVVQKAVPAGARLRVGGLVKMGSLVKSADETVSFVVTDGTHELNVAYQGLLPDLFREGQGVVAEGVMQTTGAVRAETVLAKHDERYMPREVVEALKKQGRWQEGEAAATP